MYLLLGRLLRLGRIQPVKRQKFSIRLLHRLKPLCYSHVDLSTIFCWKQAAPTVKRIPRCTLLTSRSPLGQSYAGRHTSLLPQLAPESCGIWLNSCEPSSHRMLSIQTFINVDLNKSSFGIPWVCRLHQLQGYFHADVGRHLECHTTSMRALIQSRANDVANGLVLVRLQVTGHSDHALIYDHSLCALQ